MKKAAILLSAYNGGDYIEEQIRSIYAQDYKDFALYVRDDGSDAAFVQQLQTLQEQYGFDLELGENLGFLKSFFALARAHLDADYYAFADQDDIWYASKLSEAVEWLEQKTQVASRTPLLYHCAYDVIDETGRRVDHFYFSDEDYDFRKSLTENHYSGFAMVVNRELLLNMLCADETRIDYHDWWAANIAQGFGVAHFDPRVRALHRAHSDNVTKITLGRRILWFGTTLRQESAIHKRAVLYRELFWQRLSETDKRVLALFTDRKHRVGRALCKSFYPGRWRPTLGSELAMRLLMLLGKV